MTVRNLFILTAVVCLAFAIALIFAAQALLDNFNYDPTMGGGAQVTIRGYGAVLLGLAITYWTARNSAASAGRRGLLLLITVSASMLAALNFYAILAEIVKNNGWGLVLILAVLAVWGTVLLSQENHVEG